MSLPPKYRNRSLADYFADLRAWVFSTQGKAAQYFSVHHTTIGRYETGRLTPPIDFLTGLVKMVAERLETSDKFDGSYYEQALHDINAVIRDHYPDQKFFSDWDELILFVEFNTRKRAYYLANDRGSDALFGNIDHTTTSILDAWGKNEIGEGASKNALWPAAYLRHKLGSRVEGTSWGASVPSPEDHLVYGQYISLIPGKYTVTFRMKIDDVVLPNPKDCVAILDVSSKVGKKIHAVKYVTRADFLLPNHYSDFAIQFQLQETTNEVEFRVCYMNAAQLVVEQIELSFG